MKKNKFLAGFLAMTMVAGLNVMPVAADETSFPDTETHWAKDYIEDMTDAGMFKGYDDGTFRPESQLTTSEALALCARLVGLDSDVAEAIEEDYTDDIEDIMGEDQYWFSQEYAICVEAGILDLDELEWLYTTGNMLEPIEKQDLAVYLVRAMQLGPMAESLTSYAMTFGDLKQIDDDALPYVYLLNIYGIVQGDEDGDFSPTLAVTRAVMATMLSRATDFMDERGIVADLPDYTDYDFYQGTISVVTTSNDVIILTLSRDLALEGDNAYDAVLSLSLDDDITVYEDNMETSTSALKEGRHVRVILGDNGDPIAVRVSSALTTVEGSVKSIEDNDITLSVEGSSVVLEMDRFTQVRTSNRTTGDMTIVDTSAGYTSALCKLNDQGQLVAVTFSGGSYLLGAIFDTVTTVSSGSYSTIRALDFDGTARSYTMLTGSPVTVNGLSGYLSDSYSGDYVEMRISNEDGTVISIDVNTVTDYVQGGVYKTSIMNGVSKIYVEDLDDGSTDNYEVSDSCLIYYDGEEVGLTDIPDDSFVTIRLSGDLAARIEAYPGSSVVSGIITNRTYGTGTNATQVTLEVTLDNGDVYSYVFDLTDAPTVLRSGSTSTLDKICVGEAVEITIDFNEVTKISTTTQSADTTAVIDSILKTSSGYTLNLIMDDTGDEVSYSVASGLLVTQNGVEVDVSTLDAGYKIGLVISNDQIITIEINQQTTSSTKVEGTLLYVQATTTKYLLVKVVDSTGTESAVTVNCTSSTAVYDVADGDDMALKELAIGDYVEISGSYSGSSFNATVILKTA